MENPYEPTVDVVDGTEHKGLHRHRVVWILIAAGGIVEAVATYDFSSNSYRGSPNPWLFIAFWIIPFACLFLATTIAFEPIKWRATFLSGLRWFAFGALLSLAAWICFGVTCFSGAFAGVVATEFTEDFTGLPLHASENVSFAVASVMSLLLWCYLVGKVARQLSAGR